MTKKFETYADVLADPMCSDLINKALKKISNDRTDAVVKERMNSKLVNKQSIRLKSSAFSTLKDMGILHPDGLLREFIEIQNKRSTLPSRERSFIQAIVMDAMIQTIAHYDAEEFKEATKIVTEARKKRKRSVKVMAVEGEGGG